MENRVDGEPEAVDGALCSARGQHLVLALPRHLTTRINRVAKVIVSEYSTILTTSFLCALQWNYLPLHSNIRSIID